MIKVLVRRPEKISVYIKSQQTNEIVIYSELWDYEFISKVFHAVNHKNNNMFADYEKPLFWYYLKKSKLVLDNNVDVVIWYENKSPTKYHILEINWKLV